MFITGCHRSGSSLLSGLVHDLLHGSHQGSGSEKHLKPSHDNYQGVFESQKLVQANEELLAILNAKWDAPPGSPKNWSSHEMLSKASTLRDSFYDEIRSVSWVDKDPRLCITGPFFEHVLLKRVPFSVVLRHPEEVAYSLYRRNGFGKHKSYYLWFAYNCSLASFLQNGDMIITYDLLLGDIEATKSYLTKVMRVLQIQNHRSLKLEELIRQRVSPALRRSLPSNKTTASSIQLNDLAKLAHDAYLRISKEISFGKDYSPSGANAVDLFREQFRKMPESLLEPASTTYWPITENIEISSHPNRSVERQIVEKELQTTHSYKMESSGAFMSDPLVSHVIASPDDANSKLLFINQLGRVKSISIPGKFMEKTTRLVLLSHYHADGVLQKLLQNKIDTLLSSGWKILLLTTGIRNDALLFCKSRGIAVMIRKNEGRDFGAYQDAIIWLLRNDFYPYLSQLLLLNDSCILIANSENSTWNKYIVSRAGAGCIEGFTDSYQVSYHLQSYCLKVSSDILQSNWWLNFWRDLQAWGNARQIIINGEIALSRHALLNNVTLRAMHECHRVRANIRSSSYREKLSNRFQISDNVADLVWNNLLLQATSSITAINPTHHLAIPLLIDGFPLVKRDLIESNSFNCIDPLFLIGHSFSAEELSEFLRSALRGD